MIKWYYGCFCSSGFIQKCDGDQLCPLSRAREEIHPPLGMLINVERMRKDKVLNVSWNNVNVSLFHKEIKVQVWHATCPDHVLSEQYNKATPSLNWLLSSTIYIYM